MQEQIKRINDYLTVELALFLNKDLFDEKKISYKTYKYVEKHLLKRTK